MERGRKGSVEREKGERVEGGKGGRVEREKSKNIQTASILQNTKCKPNRIKDNGGGGGLGTRLVKLSLTIT